MSKTKAGIVIGDINVGDIFSESAHYRVLAINAKNVELLQIESGEKVQLSHKYVEDLLQAADQYSTEKTVNKEDSEKSGQGIRSIFESIGDEAFTVCFVKQGKAKTQKAIADEKQAYLNEATKILAAKKAGAASKVVDLLGKALDNPIIPEEAGEDRVLRGYKIEHTSRDGRYNCVDLDITSGNNVRPVNINTIKWIVVGGVKYSVK